MILTEAQKQIVKDKHRFRVVNCGRRFGKTSLAVVEMIGKALSEKDLNVAYCAPTYQQARDICWSQLKKLAEPIAKSINESRLEILVRTQDGGLSTISLRGWESIETMRGMKLAFLVLDEVATCRNFWEMWHEVLRPTLTDLKGEALFISTPKGFNHFYDLFNLEQEDQDYKSFHFTTYDNPYIPEEEVAKAKIELPEDRFAQEYLADFRKTEGLVYKEFNRDKHIFEDESKIIGVSDHLAGLDFGYTNPAAICKIKKDFDNHYWVYDEFYEKSHTDAELAEIVAAMGFNKVYPDPENAAGVAELRRKGVNVRDVIKGHDSVRNGISVVREMFKTGRLHIHKRCKNLIYELETYSYPDKKNQRNPDENPIKENDHLCFAAGTIVNGKKIEDIGYLTGIENVFEYQIAGEKLLATPNHTVLTQRGMVPIDTLRYNDVLWKKKSLFITVLDGLDILTLIRGLFGLTFAVIQRIVEAKGRDYIDIYGKKKTELSQMDFTFIILMAIPSIILWIILSLLTAANTLANILLKKSVSLLRKISKKLLKLLLNGLRPRMAKKDEKI